MATFVSDSFTDTAATDLRDHTGETGATWTRHSSSGIDANIIVSNANRCRHNAEAGLSVYYASGTPASADYDVQATLRQVSDSSSNTGVAGRVDSSSLTLYWARYAAGSTNAWQLWKTVSGANTLLGSWGESLANGDERVVKLEMRGSTLKVYVAGVERISTTDGDITAAGFAGIRALDQASDTTGLHLDSFSATDAAAGTVVGAGLTRSLKLNRLRLVA